MELKKITQEEFDEIYRKHQLWLDGKRGEGEGERADLSFTDLRNIEFPRGLSLASSNLEGCDLGNVRAYMSNFYNTNLRDANLKDANLQRANFDNAHLEGANLSGCNLIKADLTAAKLAGSNFEEANLDRAIGLPDYLKKAKDSNLQSNLNTLEAEKIRAENALESIKKELDKKDALSDEMRDELEKEKIQREKDKKASEEKIANLEKEKEQIIQKGKDIEKGLEDAFAELEKANDNLKPDFERLQYLFYSFAGLIMVFFGLLLVLWICAFHRYSEGMRRTSILSIYGYMFLRL